MKRFTGPELASQGARSLLIDVSQTGHRPDLPQLAPTRHADRLVERAQHGLQQHMADAANPAVREPEQTGRVDRLVPRRGGRALFGQDQLDPAQRAVVGHDKVSRQDFQRHHASAARGPVTRPQADAER